MSQGTLTASIAASVAHDVLGNGNYASTSTDNSVTYDTTGPEVVTDLTAGNPTIISLTLTWTAPGDGVSNSAYDIRYSTSEITDANWDLATGTDEPTPATQGSAETFTVSGLTEGTLYYFALKTCDELSRWAELSNVPSGTPANSPPVLSDGQIDPASGYINATFTYSVVYTDGDNDPPSPITVSIDGGTPAEMTELDDADTDFTDGKLYQYYLSGSDLGVGTEHTYQFAAYDGTYGALGDTGIYTGPVVKSKPGGGGTSDTSPPRISDIECSNYTKTSVIIVWETNERSTSRVEYWASEHQFSPLDESLVKDHQVILTNLKPCCEYHFQIISEDSDDNEAISEENTFTTLGTPATFTVSDLSISPDEVEIGESVTISVMITNTGDVTGTYEVALKLDNVSVVTKEVTLDGGSSQKLTFTTAMNDEGTHQVDIADLSGTVAVNAVAVPTRTPPTQTQTPTLPSTPPSSTPPDGPNWWLIGGIIAAVVAAGLLGYFYVWRRRGVSRLT